MLVERGTVMQRISWIGILAGTLVGIITQLVLTVLGVAIGAAVIDGLGDFGSNLGWGTIAWLLVSLAISAFLAGLTAARAAGYLTPAQGRFNGLLTGMLLVFAVTTFGFNTLLSGIRSAVGFAGNAVTATAGAAQGAGVGSALTELGPVQQFLGGFNETEIEEVIAEAVPELNPAQVAILRQVVSNVINNAVNTTNFGDLSNLNEIAPRTMENILQALSGEELVNRLQLQGLPPAAAAEVAAAVEVRATEIRAIVEQNANAIGAAARDAVATAAWSWLLAVGLILGLATFGGGRGHDVPQAGATMLPNEEDERQGRRT